jgi:hypothetical protein
LPVKTFLKNLQFYDICGYKKVGQLIFSPSFVAVVGSGIRDRGSGIDKNQDPG